MSKPFRLFLLSFLLISQLSMGQDKLSAVDQIALQEGNSAFMNMAYEDAIDIYKGLENKDPNNDFLKYRIGFCYLELKEIDNAIKYFEQVNGRGLKKKYFDFYYAYGQALQRQGKYNTALENYNEFLKNGRSKDIKYYEVERFIKQCNYAIEAVKNPVSVQIGNMGDYINSDYDDFHPIVSLDGKMMVFTSRRSSDNNLEMLEDGQYFENVFYTTWNEENEDWNESAPIPGKLNSKEYDANTGISPDGNSILVYKNSNELNKKTFSGVGSGDILISKKGKNGLWSASQVVEGINSTYFDGGACFSPDGNKIYFISDRQGMMYGDAQGAKDIWVSEIQADGTWGKPENLGETINTPYNEISVYMHPNGKTLFFASEGHDDKNLGGFDIFKSELKNGTWSTPENIGFPINTAGDEKEFYLSADGKTGWISARKEDKKRTDIFQVNLSFYNVITGTSEDLAILKGSVKDQVTGYLVKTKIKFTNKTTGEVTEVSSDEDGKYVTPLAANTTYTVSIIAKGYNNFSKDYTLQLPKEEEPTRKRRAPRRKRGEVEQPITTAEIYETTFNISLSRSEQLNIINKDLLQTQNIRFEKEGTSYKIHDFSLATLGQFADQLNAEQKVNVQMSAHFVDENDERDASLAVSQQLGDLVKAFLIERGVAESRITLWNMGNSQPLVESKTEEGRKANRRVEIKIVL